ncbi:ABC transporter ATP-binding protein [Cohnella terricola]|uniref:ABC transporter ATP-binding protein n=1 Tax=Cohnella terricola TaxID=1289167 RepID=A0A559JGU2_9BACL|nr:ABC transporter ATP-binding protein [Cohnella terricola]TVX99094.1 ABC transporter ATP-binding protein [Cohnella terricola]
MDNRQKVLDVRALEIEIVSERGRMKAVQHLSFGIETGQVLGIVGESGCGKSMTCMSILGLLPDSAHVTRGSIRLNGIELTGLSSKKLMQIRRHQLSLVLQNPMTAFNPLKTIGSQFVETLRLKSNCSKKQAFELATQRLAEMNLPEPDRVLSQYPFELSGGMLQRIMIGLATANNPTLLIADEPTTALDNGNREHVLNAIRRIKAKGGTAMLLVSHDLSVIEAVADTVIVMKKGQIVESGLTKDVIRHPQAEYTKLLCDSRLTWSNPNQDRSQERVEIVQV